MEFALQNDGTPTYSLNYKSKAVVKPSKLGLELKNDKKSLQNDFTVLDTKQRLLMKLTPVWEKVASFCNHYN
jgi:hypothetical protein